MIILPMQLCLMITEWSPESCLISTKFKKSRLGCNGSPTIYVMHYLSIFIITAHKHFMVLVIICLCIMSVLIMIINRRLGVG